MRNHPLLPHLLNPIFLDQSQQRMERAPHLERPNALEILALEEQPDLRLRRLLALPLRAFQRFGGLWRGCEVRERRVGLHLRLVDVRLDELVGGAHGGGVQGTRGRVLGHSDGDGWCGERGLWRDMLVG